MEGRASESIDRLIQFNNDPANVSKHSSQTLDETDDGSLLLKVVFLFFFLKFLIRILLIRGCI